MSYLLRLAAWRRGLACAAAHRRPRTLSNDSKPAGVPGVKLRRRTVTLLIVVVTPALTVIPTATISVTFVCLQLVARPPGVVCSAPPNLRF